MFDLETIAAGSPGIAFQRCSSASFWFLAAQGSQRRFWASKGDLRWLFHERKLLHLRNAPRGFRRTRYLAPTTMARVICV